MRLIQIPFAHFHEEVKEFIAAEHLAYIDAYRQVFYKCGHIYLAIAFQDNKLVVEYAVNTGKRNEGDWTAIVRTAAIEWKNIGVVFCTSTSNRFVHKIAEKWNMTKIKELPNFYSNGDSSIMYEYIFKEGEV